MYYSYADWSQELLYHQQYADIFLFHFGRYGVQLFFIISGFVIAMTLKKQLHDAYPNMPDYLLPILPTIVVVMVVTMVAWIIAQYLDQWQEKPLNN